jgi:hypothetical protein
MNLKLKRIFKGDKYTIGHLYINGRYQCDTLEDKVRDLTKEPKVYGETAIPAGIYEIDMNTVSPRFKYKTWARKYKGIVPRLKNVPYFEGVLLHPGNSAADSKGCILCGDNQIVGGLVNSQKHWFLLMDKLIAAIDRGEKITIEIV